MADLIDRRAAIDEILSLQRNREELLSDVLHNMVVCQAYDKIEALPSAEPEIVRCKDCINYTRGKDEWGSCFENPMKLWRETDYCSWAERKTDETD